ncbi:GFA family protein [Novosphingobium sp. G106]|uniref:GFA family protein n=1 Tax=Novosphingobium sp. G106 TaxID=2849500 RepID=UPI001C2CFF92|nr:GFA family protein [Novosphingobium sp. G106]MBV1688041.1 GFA family protein [Novosphingobium sp. G106]
MAYSGSCHCGAVTFTVEGDPPAGAMSCNCSHCRRKGFLLSFVPAEQFRLDSGEDSLVTYTFNKHAIAHRFCKTCGAQPFAEGENGGVKMRGINLRCVPDIDLDALTIQQVDGASH